MKGAGNQTEGTFKVAKLRDDVPVMVEQNHMAPFMGLLIPHGQVLLVEEVFLFFLEDADSMLIARDYLAGNGMGLQFYLQ